MPFGTLQTLDDLESVTTTIADFNEQTLAQRVQQAVDLYNRGVAEAIRDFATVTAAYQLPYGTLTDDTGMQELDEWGSPDADKTTAAGSLGLPLRRFGKSKQWTRLFVLNTPVSQLATELNDMAAKDAQNLKRRILQALVKSTNTLNYNDRFATRNTYDLRALLNADGMAIPPGPNGETFTASSHTHYLASTTLDDAFAASIIDTVVEHGVDGGIVWYINRTQESAVRNLTGNGGFQAYVDARIRPADSTSFATGGLDVNNTTDRAIGLYYGAEVWVKPWVPSNYHIVFDAGASDKPLGIRTRSGSLAAGAEQGGFGLIFDNEQYPLRAKAVGREFGVGVINRHKAAVGYSGGGTYVIPTITG